MLRGDCATSTLHVRQRGPHSSPLLHHSSLFFSPLHFSSLPWRYRLPFIISCFPIWKFLRGCRHMPPCAKDTIYRRPTLAPEGFLRYSRCSKVHRSDSKLHFSRHPSIASATYSRSETSPPAPSPPSSPLPAHQPTHPPFQSSIFCPPIYRPLRLVSRTPFLLLRSGTKGAVCGLGEGGGKGYSYSSRPPINFWVCSTSGRLVLPQLPPHELEDFCQRIR